VPHRGRPNEPALLPLVGATVAEVKGAAVESIAASTAAAAAVAFALAV
jgi:Tat protein secretion system quality control protein TatD with DNase activity